MTTKPRPPALDPATVTPQVGTGYPPPHDAPCTTRARQVLGDPVGLTQFGVNLLTLPPGAWSSQRHWHRNEDEFIYVLEGEVTMISDGGEQVLTPGLMAGFPAGKRDGHHLMNRSDKPARVLEVGTRAAEEYAEYPDIDMNVEVKGKDFWFRHMNGDPY